MNGTLDRRILSSLPARLPFVTRVVVLDAIDSTNEEARRLVEEGAPEGTVVIAAQQTAGRGRMGRGWHSPAGPGLYLSIVLRPRGPVAQAPRWALAAAAAGAEACERLGVPGIEVKWPNDLLLGGRKVAGFLAEMRSLAGGATELVLGAGFNVSHADEDFPPDLRGTATSLARGASGRAPSRESVAEAFLERLSACASALAAGRFGEIADRWSARAPRACGARVRIGDARGDFDAVTRGLDGDGALVVERADGTRATVFSGDAVVSWEAADAARGGCR